MQANEADGLWVAPSLVNAAGDALFPLRQVSSVIIFRQLPDLRCCGLTAQKRAPCYAADPNAWYRQPMEDPASGLVGTLVLVPRRYQLWALAVWRLPLASLLRARP